MKPSIIYCDLDGVLADFDRKYLEEFGLSRSVVDQDSDQEFWERINIYRVQHGNRRGWFNSLDPMPDGLELWYFLKSLHIPLALLTATGMDREHAVYEKTQWIAKNLGPDVVALFVSSGKEKHKYATKNAILIDDTPKCVTPWRTAGGAAILHTNTNDTIQQLYDIMDGTN